MMKLIATNRKAHRDYFITDAVECGIALLGSEVKSLRDGRLNLEESFARIDPEGMTLYSAHISPYAQASYLNADPVRPRRLLLHKEQLARFDAHVAQRGCTLIPLRAYFNDRGMVKIEIALGKGKKHYDRRDDIKRRETDREMRRAVKGIRK